MKNVFIDTEFLEGRQSYLSAFPNFVTKPFLDLISIALVDENGNEYYAISKNFNVKAAFEDDFIRENVLKEIFYDSNFLEHTSGKHFTFKNIEYLINKIGQSKSEIAIYILAFIHDVDGKGLEQWNGGTLEYFEALYEKEADVNIWAYSGTSDYTCLYRIFSDKLIDRPAFMSTNFHELKTLLLVNSISKLERNLKCPKQKNIHNALADAKWNKRLFDLFS